MRRAAALVVFAALFLTACPKTDGGTGSTTTTGASSTTTTTLPRAAAALCAAPDPQRTGSLADPAITELSGLVQSRAHPGVFWVHNDSGDTARIFAIDEQGATLHEYAIAGAGAVDWEDIAIAPGDSGQAELYIGDIGDNGKSRDHVTVYEVPEPDPSQEVPAQAATARRLTYPDGAHDAEARFVDPTTRDLFVVTKELSGSSEVFRLPAGQSALTKVTTLDLGLAQLVTAGDISADGSTIVLRTYNEVFVWDRRTGESVGDAFTRPPCRAPAPQDRQGEAIGLDPDGRGYVTSSEGANAPIWRVSAGG
jgi:hypothetical protein